MTIQSQEAVCLSQGLLLVCPVEYVGCNRLHSVIRLSQDLRSDRQPEFTQLDMEMAFMDQAAIVQLTERLIAAVFREVGRPEA